MKTQRQRNRGGITMMKAVIMGICLLLVTTVAYSSVIPSSSSNKNIFVRSGGEVRYTSMYKLGQIVYMLNEDATSSRRQFKVSKSGSSYLLDYYGNNQTNIKFYIDSNNFLKKVVIKKGVQDYTLDDSKPEEMVGALTFILPFNDKHAERAEAKRKADQEKENKFVEDNMLNFEAQMPLFAGLTWGDTFANALEKVRKVNGVKELEAYCDFDRSFYDPMAEKLKAMQSMGRRNSEPQGEKSQTDRIKEALRGGDLSAITSEDAKVATEYIDNCKISGKLILFNSEAELTVHLGKTSFGGQVPYYLNHISICGDFEANLVLPQNLWVKIRSWRSDQLPIC